MAGRGHHTSHHGKHHVSHAHHESAKVHHHHMARGGHTEPEGSPAEDEREEHKALDYTAESNVVPEAEGKRRSHGGRMKKAHGGGVHTKHEGKHHVSHAHHEEATVHHHHYKRGGGPKKHVDGEGHKMARRLDHGGRPGRKRGGGVGADMTPLTTAAKTTEAGAHKADNDELAH